jgi:hypothetical protein
MRRFSLDLSVPLPVDQLHSDDTAIANFVHLYFSAIDILYPSSPDSALAQFFKPDAEFVANGGPAVPQEKVFEMLEMRSKMLSAFTHADDKIRVSWGRDTNGNYTVLCEGVSR